ncbi:hypothetical protein HDE_13552 [Halotydeus destructor]|nr:hypothetical protein HDE_13552 [Halotydeus destructor]
MEEVLIRPCKSDPAINCSSMEAKNSQSSTIRLFVDNYDSEDEFDYRELEEEIELAGHLKRGGDQWCYSPKPTTATQLLTIGNLSLGVEEDFAEVDYVTFNVSSDEILQDVITIEGLRSLYSSCFSCGVNWQDGHFDLDCRECGCYAMTRPCLDCDGKCGSNWRRNITLSHESRKANWEGECCFRQSKVTEGRFVVSKTESSMKKVSSHQSVQKSLLSPSLKVA